MAQLLRQAIDSGATPSLARIPMTPEEVAASYDEAEGPDAMAGLGSAARDKRDDCRRGRSLDLIRKLIAGATGPKTRTS
jgi:hypothetical protein